MSKLLGYDFTIKYKLGSCNIVVDALYRIPLNGDSKLLVLSIPHFIFMDKLLHSLSQNAAYVELRTPIAQNPNAHSDFTIHNNTILQQGKIWLPLGHEFIPTLLEEFHKTSLGGHT